MLTVSAPFIQVLFYVGALTVVGLALHGSLRIHDMRRLLAFAAGGFALVVCLRLFLLNAQLAGSLSKALSMETFEWVWFAHAAQTWVIALAIGLILIGSIFRPPKWRRLLWTAGAIAIAVSFGLSGHVYGLEAPGLAPGFAGLHVLIASFWIAAPITLWPKSSVSDTDLLKKVKRFSSVAVWGIPVLFVSGLWLLWRIGGSPVQILSELYGRLLVLKLIIALGLLGLGAFNKIVITERLISDPQNGRALLRRTLTMEAVLFAAVLLIIALATTLFGPGHTSA